MPVFPTVPIAPGVPPVNRVPGATFANVVLLTADAVSIISALAGPSWGVFNSFGTQVIGQQLTGIVNFALGSLTGFGSGNFMDLDFKNRFSISKAPQEQGAFMSYNKVNSPYDVAITVTAGGTVQNRQLLISQVIAIIGSTDLFEVRMPEGPLAGLNPVGYQFSRKADRGLGLLVVEIFFEQVRPAGNPAFSTTATPSSTGAAAPTTGGAAPITSPVNPSSTSTQSLGVLSPATPSPQLTSQVRAGGL